MSAPAQDQAELLSRAEVAELDVFTDSWAMFRPLQLTALDALDRLAEAKADNERLLTINDTISKANKKNLDRLAEAERNVHFWKDLADRQGVFWRNAMTAREAAEAECAKLRAKLAGRGTSDSVNEPLLTTDEQRQQGERCGCWGADDYCPCQNVPDKQTRTARAALSQSTQGEH